MHRIRHIVLFAGIVTLLCGCLQVGSIRVPSDTPEDLETLIEAHEYVRVRQLTGKHPELDSMEMQERLRRHEQAYEKSVWSEASTLEADRNLHDAVTLLSNALQKMPHSSQLRDLRNSIEQNRVHQLNINEREILLARGHYLVAQLQIYEENVKLESPGMSRLLKHEQNQADAIRLAEQLRSHAQIAMEHDDISATRACLKLSRKLHDTREAAALQSEIQVIEQSVKKTTQQKASIKKARIKRKQNLEHKEQTGKLLAETQLALSANQLHAAREAFIKIPSSSSNDSEVLALQERLDKAINTRIEQLITSGDAHYRAEDINSALKAWNEALSLSPENTEILERTERANKVLARLEELKQQQH